MTPDRVIRIFQSFMPIGARLVGGIEMFRVIRQVIQHLWADDLGPGWSSCAAILKDQRRERTCNQRFPIMEAIRRFSGSHAAWRRSASVASYCAGLNSGPNNWVGFYDSGRPQSALDKRMPGTAISAKQKHEKRREQKPDASWICRKPVLTSRTTSSGIRPFSTSFLEIFIRD